MPIFGRAHRFTGKNIDRAPDQPGVYALVAVDDVVFYGCASEGATIRGRLRDHHSGRRPPGRDVIRTFSYEVTRFPLARECALLEEHMRHNWRLPAYNQQAAHSRPVQAAS